MIIKESFDDYLRKSASKTNAKAIILAFLKYKPDEIKESEITHMWLVRFKEYLEERELAANSRHSYMSTMTSIISKAKSRGYQIPISDMPETKKDLVINTEGSESVFLTKDELKLIEKYEPKGKNETFARAAFLIGAYTGARISDTIIMSENNFNNGELNFTSEKTKTTSRLPLHHLVPELVKHTHGKKYSEKSGSAIVCSGMKSICAKLGINKEVTLYRRGRRMTVPKYECIGSHTARKSFATNMLLDGYELIQISKMMGHGKGKGDEKMTSGYICTSYHDKIKGNRTYLKPTIDENYELFKRMINFGLTDKQALISMMVQGVSDEEIQRLKSKHERGE